MNCSKKTNNFTFSECMISNCPLVPMDIHFPQANASRHPWRSSKTPDLAAFINEVPGFCNKIPEFQIKSHYVINHEPFDCNQNVKTDRKACLHKGWWYGCMLSLSPDAFSVQSHKLSTSWQTIGNKMQMLRKDWLASFSCCRCQTLHVKPYASTLNTHFQKFQLEPNKKEGNLSNHTWRKYCRPASIP